MRSDVPEGWSPKSIGSLLDWDAPGFWGESPESGGDPVKVLRSTNFTESGIPNLDDIALRCFPERIRTQKALQFGDILLERSGGGPNTPVGRVVLFEERDPHFYSNFIQALRVGAEADYRFLFYVLWNMHKTGVTSTLQQATTGIRNLSYKDYLAWRLPLPPLAEQRKIAAILTSVDEAIQATEAVIAQTRRVKEGLLQELLTRGIGHTRFKQTEIGEIPETWEVRRGDELFTCGGGYAPKDIIFSREGDAMYLKASDLAKAQNGAVITCAESRFDPKQQNLNVRTYPKGSIVFAKRGAAIMKNRVRILGAPAAVDPNLMVLCCTGIHSEFLAAYLTHYDIASFVDEGTIPQINNRHLYPHPFPVPTEIEQLKTVNALRGIQTTAESQLSALTQLQQLKSGLLQDLLTGRVRVGNCE